MRFIKYHGLGNDYIVVAPGEFGAEPPAERIALICHRNYGVGSDGVLLGPLSVEDADFGVRIFNPDGSEAEKSGNGLRIFSRYLFDMGLVARDSFAVSTPGGVVRCQVLNNGASVAVEMGTVSFDSALIPVLGPRREVIDERMSIGGEELTYCAATIGNPHCVIVRDTVSAHEAKALGPLIEFDPRFPNRTNVQFLSVMDRGNIEIEIWERGAGYTLASGSSSCAAAAVAHKLGLCDRQITVHSPGGCIDIVISDDFSILMTGPVTRVCDGTISKEAFGH